MYKYTLSAHLTKDGTLMTAHLDSFQSVTASQVYKSTFVSHSSTLSSNRVQYPIEVSFCDQEMAQLAYLLRLLKQASEQNRWIMFIGEDALLDRNLMKSAGIDVNKVLLLKKKIGQSTQALMAKALHMGNCSAVIASGNILEYCNQTIHDAAIHGDAMAFIINRNHQPGQLLH
ncbi:SulA-like leucine-rich domain-containing protein [Photobacterium sp. CCB-ST2H9]|uniref:cell division inhibitor SulA n=1 Tax=Photobacterium sp. CCB-ST2H9 TaxID=2912855 RepID=UPI0020C6C4AE|nr:SulA-like leucine-rich domain-containing protein [Photobacterium sp. CCB-ST2H9]UTM58767.1 SulA-like leucine-rich domain-containing protein [Photobacterium sp. CCB-ST2H9]